MAMGKRRERQRELWVETAAVTAPGNLFYERLSKIFDEYGFDEFAEEVCSSFYADKLGRPSLPPGVYFRLLLLGHFEKIDSERGIAWRVADSISLRRFLGYEITDATPVHSTISRTRRLIDIETHEKVFDWVLQALGKSGLLRGKTLGVDATTLEANAALRSIVQRTTGESYQEYMARLAEASGIETPTRDEIARFDRRRKGRSTSNRDWEHPHDPDARITRMKDGRTHLAHKAEHAVDMDTGAIVAVTVQPADRGDTLSLGETLDEVARVLEGVLSDDEAAAALSDELMKELVADKGYHSNAVLSDSLKSDMRTYISEPDRGRRNWKGKDLEKEAVYSNRRRVKGERGMKLLRSRGEKLERPFAHCYSKGGMRRVHLRGHENIRKRLLIHVAGFNLGILLRDLLGAGTPRGFRGLVSLLEHRFVLHWAVQRLSDLAVAFSQEQARRLRSQCAHLVEGLPRFLLSPDMAFATGC